MNSLPELLNVYLLFSSLLYILITSWCCKSFGNKSLHTNLYQSNEISMCIQHNSTAHHLQYYLHFTFWNNTTINFAWYNFESMNPLTLTIDTSITRIIFNVASLCRSVCLSVPLFFCLPQYASHLLPRFPCPSFDWPNICKTIGRRPTFNYF